jgi:hypothetical protein
MSLVKTTRSGGAPVIGEIFTEDYVFYKPKGELFLLKVMSAVPTKVSPRLQRRGDQDLLQRSRRVSSTMR